MKRNRVVLVILDGWGIGPDYEGNAIKLARTPTMDKLWTSFPHAQLSASGEAVGLPAGESGNTETGHLNIGAGRIVYQDLPRINMAISSGSFFKNEALLKAVKNVEEKGANFHTLGLIGQGGVHSSNSHLYALLRFCREKKLKQVYLHLITDGRDSAPTSALSYIAEVKGMLSEIGIGKIATVVGRYYAMDRDRRWERTKIAYDGLVNGIGTVVPNLENAVSANYNKNLTDEFFLPLLPEEAGKFLPRIASGDSVVFFNYRVDRPRQLTRALTLKDEELMTREESFDPMATKYYKSHLKKPVGTALFKRENLPEKLFFVTMTEYEKNLPVAVAFPPEFVQMPLSRVIALSGRRQLKLAESEKERFVTYYFNGQREQRFPGEDVDITPSPKVPTYDTHPEMSGKLQTDKLVRAIYGNLYDFIAINYANPDMVAHTGNLQATIKACEFVDSWIDQIYHAVLTRDDTSLVITADHGNAEELINLKKGGIDTEHSDFPVPCIIASKSLHAKGRTLHSGILADVAPTILTLMGLKQPASMNGRSLL